MTAQRPAKIYRFGTFEADAVTGELRRQGIRVKLGAQPFQVLAMLLERPGELLTREEISRELWPDGTFVDYQNGVNSAVNRIRDALNDSAANPRFIETLARRGYRFVAPVERMGRDAPPAEPAVVEMGGAESARSLLATEEDLPRTSHGVVVTLLVLLQAMYVGFYVGALANVPEIEDLLSALPRSGAILVTMIVTAALLIPVRAFIASAVLFRPPRMRDQLLKLWPFVLPFDVLWALAPFLLLHHMNFGVALACTALLVYSPFAQRSLVLMHAHRE